MSIHTWDLPKKNQEQILPCNIMNTPIEVFFPKEKLPEPQRYSTWIVCPVCEGYGSIRLYSVDVNLSVTANPVEKPCGHCNGKKVINILE